MHHTWWQSVAPPATATATVTTAVTATAAETAATSVAACLPILLHHTMLLLLPPYFVRSRLRLLLNHSCLSPYPICSLVSSWLLLLNHLYSCHRLSPHPPLVLWLVVAPLPPPLFIPLPPLFSPQSLSCRSLVALILSSSWMSQLFAANCHQSLLPTTVTIATTTTCHPPPPSLSTTIVDCFCGYHPSICLPLRH
jgi:hypothetical protein